MLLNNFTLIKGIGERTQSYLNQSQVFTWDDFLLREEIPGFSPQRKKELDSELLELKKRLQALEGDYFASLLPRVFHWMLFPFFESACVFLDIETTGCRESAYTTVLGLADLKGFQNFVRGKNLDAYSLKKALAPYKMVVSFYGTVFDLPFLQREFPDLPIYSLPHFDLCFGGRKVGLKGGLKEVELQNGMQRPPEIAGLDGYKAVLLWDEHLKGNPRALDLLLSYNRQDTCNLVPLAKLIYRRLTESAL